MIKYVVDAKARTVTATLEDCHDDVVKTFNRRVGYPLIQEGTTLHKAAQIDDTFVGVARCHPDDTFDETEGKRRAKKRLLDRQHRAKVEAELRLIDHLGLLMEHVDCMIDHEDEIMAKYK